jgi:hypothetical protein
MLILVASLLALLSMPLVLLLMPLFIWLFVPTALGLAAFYAIGAARRHHVFSLLRP